MTADNFVNRIEVSGGTVQGFIQENYGTVTQNFITQVSELVSGQVSVTENDLTQEQYRQRTVLLSKVKDYWIKGVLEKSLHTEAMIELGLEERTELVERPFTGASEESRESLPTGTSAIEFFDQIGDGRTLLILGEPGSGKTITLLKLAQNLITGAEGNVKRLIPVVFNLSSWRLKQKTIANWLLEELLSKYGVPKAFSKDWVEQQKLILMLDGLDEVKAEYREACVQAINQFMKDHAQTEVVVCSRIAEYEDLSSHLQLRGSVFIRSLTPEQINKYLDRAGEQLQAVKTLLQEDNSLQDLAKSPLTLSVMTLAYRGKRLKELPQTGSVEERRQHLFDTYIKRMFSQEKIGKPREYKSPYQNQQTILWLAWLAQRMNKKSESIFFIEELQPSWLLVKPKIYSSKLFIKIVTEFLIKIFIRVFVYLVITIFLICLLGIPFFTPYWSDMGTFLHWLFYWLYLYSIFVVFLTFIVGIEEFFSLLFPSLFETKNNTIKPVDLINWKILNLTDWRISKKWIDIYLSLYPVIIVSLFFAVSWFLGLGVLFKRPYEILFVKLTTMIKEMIYSRKIQETDFPNQAIINTLKNVFILFLFGWGNFSIVVLTIFAMFQLSSFWQWLLGLLVLPMALVLSCVGLAGTVILLVICVKHFLLRLTLWRDGFVPWNYSSFLDHSADRIFLRKVGGGYIFIHRMLQEHFARMNSDSRKLS